MIGRMYNEIKSNAFNLIIIRITYTIVLYIPFRKFSYIKRLERWKWYKNIIFTLRNQMQIKDNPWRDVGGVLGDAPGGYG